MKMNAIRAFLSVVIWGLMTVSCSAKSGNPDANVTDLLTKAKEDGKTVIMVVSNKTASAEKLTLSVNEAVKDIEKITVVQMNTDDAANAEMVTKYRLGDAPLPLVLLFSNKGVAIGGLLEDQVNKESIADAIPTPKEGDIIYALSLGKPVFAVVSKNNFEEKDKTIATCKKSQFELNGNAEVIEIDLDDSKESKLIEKLYVDKTLTKPFTVVINAQGLMSGKFTGIPDQAQLLAAAKKVMQTGCAPGGCSPSCN